MAPEAEAPVVHVRIHMRPTRQRSTTPPCRRYGRAVWAVGAALAVVMACLIPVQQSAFALNTGAFDATTIGAGSQDLVVGVTNTERKVRALIVQYRPGVSPRTADGAPRGVRRVTGPLRATLRLGSGLGLNMWRVDFTSPVTLADARRVARQMAADPGVAFAEPDSPVAAAR